MVTTITYVEALDLEGNVLGRADFQPGEQYSWFPDEMIGTIVHILRIHTDSGASVDQPITREGIQVVLDNL